MSLSVGIVDLPNVGYPRNDARQAGYFVRGEKSFAELFLSHLI